MQINYEKPVEVIKSAVTTIATSETDLMIVKDGNFTRQTQLTGYFNVTLNTATNVKIRYYMSPDGGTTWYQMPTKVAATGILTDLPSLITSASPTQSGAYLVVEDIKLSATSAIKVTGQATTDVATLNAAYLWVRDN